MYKIYVENTPYYFGRRMVSYIYKAEKTEFVKYGSEKNLLIKGSFYVKDFNGKLPYTLEDIKSKKTEVRFFKSKKNSEIFKVFEIEEGEFTIFKSEYYFAEFATELYKVDKNKFLKENIEIDYYIYKILEKENENGQRE
jgi:hypothetical protein